MDKRSFLAGVSLGRSLKGWSGSGGSGAAPGPRCFVDEGELDHFYIDYRRGVQLVTYGRFRNKTILLGSAGEIVPTEVEQLDGRTVRVWADLTGHTLVQIFGNAEPGMTYVDGATVGAFAAVLYPQGGAPAELPYLAEAMALGALPLAAVEACALRWDQPAGQHAVEALGYGPVNHTGADGCALTYTES